MNESDQVEVTGKGDNEQVTITLGDLESLVRQDLDRHQADTMKERVEGIIYMVCLAVGAFLLMIHAFTDWIPYLVGLPSARVIITRFLL